MSAQNPIYEPTSPIPVPKYAGQVEGKPRVRFCRYYQTATDAKTLLVAQLAARLDPISYNLTGTYEFRNNVRIFKLNEEAMEYEIIFDSRSALALLFMSGALTKDQLLARIFE